MDVKNININARELQFRGGIMTGSVDKLSLREKSGWVCNSISGSAKVGRGCAIVEDFRLKDKWSDIYLPLYMMTFDSVDDFGDYITRSEWTERLQTATWISGHCSISRLRSETTGSGRGCPDR